MAYKYQRIREMILENALRTGAERLPSEHEICALYGVSRTTAIRALNSLADDHLVRREVGRGTFVNRSQVKTRVGFLVSKHVRELVRFAEEAAELFGQSHPYMEVRVHPIDSRDWIRAIVNIPGPKVICSSHVGFLSAMNLLYPLSRLDLFQDALSQINSDLVIWQRGGDGDAVCHSLPLFSAPEVLAYNREYARQLGLDTAQGPRDWHDIETWTAAARTLKRRVMGCHLKRDNLLPLSYYLTLTGGKPLIREDGPKVTFEFERGEEWLAFFRGLYQSGRMQDWERTKPDPVLSGRSLLSLSASTWLINQTKEHKTGDAIGVCPIPSAEANGTSFSSVGKGELAIVGDPASDPSEAEVAWQFVRFLTCEPMAQRILARTWHGLATNRVVYQEQQADPQWAPYIRAFATGRRRCDHPAQHSLMKIVYAYYYAAVAGSMSCAEAAERIQEGCRLQLEINDGTHIQ